MHDQADACTRWLVSECGLGIPTVLISITGGAQTLKLSPEVQQTFERGLVRAARTKGAPRLNFVDHQMMCHGS